MKSRRSNRPRMGAREPPDPIPQIFYSPQAVGRKAVPTSSPCPPTSPAGRSKWAEPRPTLRTDSLASGHGGTPAQNTPPTSLAPPFRGLTILPQKDRQGRRGWGVEGKPVRVCAVWTPGQDPARTAHPAPLELNRLHVSAPARATRARVDRVASPEPGSAPSRRRRR